MQIDSDILQYDFQGWPEFKMTVREILEELGIEKLQTTGVDKYVIRADDPILDSYPIIRKDDGMGYCTQDEYIYSSYIQDGEIVMWCDPKRDEK